MEKTVIKLILSRNLTAVVTFGYMDRFMRILSEFDGQNVTLNQIKRDVSSTSYFINIEIPHNDFRPIINHYKKQLRTEIYVK
jgi:hypothetical protein